MIRPKRGLLKDLLLATAVHPQGVLPGTVTVYELDVYIGRAVKAAKDINKGTVVCRYLGTVGLASELAEQTTYQVSISIAFFVSL
jgi:hypothetical protein